MKAKLKVALFLIILREEREQGQFEVLLQKRQNTGYMDGKWDFGASGHLEDNGESFEEGMVREAKEELGIDVNPEMLEMVFVGHDPYEQYLKVFFEVFLEDCAGVPRIMEPEKNARLKWVLATDLPKDAIPYLQTVLECINQDVHYSTL